MKALVLATHNKGKVKELSALLDGLVAEIKTAEDLRLKEPPEYGTTFIENAKMKAVTAMQTCGYPCLADDSGLSVNALGGEPGVYSADWAGHPRDFKMAMQMVHDKMGDAADKGAHFTSVLALAYPDGRVETFEGRVDGALCWPPRGLEGFGYDPMFVPVGHTKTFGEMTLEEKQDLSHRAIATQKFIDFLKGEKA
jgi:XTP/dITP diphosphohydrolase